ncbi:MAG: hypothetical protein FJX74_18265 [Armatimonadetes bacterium]|nr:hypothetical protein [Armatimonadota bacterium]
MNWYAQAFRKMHFDMHTPGDVTEVGVDFDAEDFARQLDDIGVEAICWFAKCGYGWSYYPTQVGRRHPHLAVDTFPPVVEACHARGIRVLGYYHVSGCEWAEGHPEWHARNADGSVCRDGNIRYSICPMGPAGTELIIPQLVEIVTLQPADGLFLDDLLGWKVCYCDACREGYGQDPPVSPADEGWDAFLAWRREAAEAFFGQAAGEVHRARPEALFGVNYAGSFRHPDLAPKGLDYLTADIPEPESSSLNASLLCRQHATQPLPYDAMNSRMLHWWTDWTQKPVTAMKQEFATVLANGGRTFLGDIAYHRTALPDRAVLRNAGEAFALCREIEPYARGAEPAPDLAILNSAASHYLGTHAPNADPIPVKGAHLALLEAGLHAHVLPEHELPGLLGEYTGLVIPEQTHLADETLAAIRAFVAGGGGLVAIGDTQLADVLGLERVGLSDEDRSYFVCEAEDLNPSDEVTCPPRLVPGRAMLANATTATVLAPLVAPLAGGPPHSGAPPGRPTPHAAISLDTYGAGRTAFVAAPIATDLFARGHAALAPLIAGLVRRVCEPRVAVEADGTLEVSLLRRGPSLLVHLVTYSASRHPGRPATVDRLAPVHDVTIRLRTEAEPLLVDGSVDGLRWSYRDGIAEITLSKVDLWACVEVQEAGGG